MTDKVTEEAIAWHLHQQREDADWDAFARWLEADPAHREAYDEIALMDDLVERHRGTLDRILAPEPEELPESVEAAQAAAPRRRIGWALGGGGIIAAAAASMLVLIEPASSPAAVYTTGPNQTREVALDDGSIIQVAPSSRLEVAGKAQTELTLSGAATFAVPHRPNREMVIHAGGVDLHDIGTRFDVATGASTLRVAVAEGRLVASLANRQPVHVEAGKRLVVDVARGVAELRNFAAQDFASWRSGRLVYEDAPLSLVVADVSRYSGAKIVVDPGISGRRFSGVLTIGDGSQLVRNLADFMAVDARTEGKAVRLVARDRS